MNAQDRRQEIIRMLSSSQEAVSGTELAKRYQVSRQIIVSDISLLKASGYDILATHKGYIIPKSTMKERVFKLKHTTEETEDELSIIVGLGGIVVDVFVWHKAYGKIEVPLNIFSEVQVKQFIEAVRTGKSTELMNITGGYHYHTVRADSAETLDKIEAALKNYIVPEI